MTDTSASPESIAAVTELPPLDVTKEDRAVASHRYKASSIEAARMANEVPCRERQLLAERTARLLSDETVASQAAEMAALRSEMAAMDEDRDVLVEQRDATEAENTRLRDALNLARSHVEIIFGPTFFTTDICIGIDAALSAPGAKREG